MLNCYCREHLIVYAFCGLNCNIMINNNTISGTCIYILTNPVLINDTTGFYACLQFDKAGYGWRSTCYIHLLSLSRRII
jgi:hypothetical protein